MPRKPKLGGRPPLPKTERKRHRVTVWLTDAERRALRASAAGAALGARARELLVAALEREGR
jgi:hypothetical protein